MPRLRANPGGKLGDAMAPGIPREFASVQRCRELGGGVAVRIGHDGHRNPEVGAERLPAVAEPVHEQPLGRHAGLDLGGVGLVDADDVVAVERPATEQAWAISATPRERRDRRRRASPGRRCFA